MRLYNALKSKLVNTTFCSPFADLGFTQGYCARVQLPCYIEDYQLGSVF